MEFQQIIDSVQPAIIQIAAEGNTGTGFYLKHFGVVVTNEHVVGSSAEASIAGSDFHKMLTAVWYIDRKHDLAFLEPPAGTGFPDLRLGDVSTLRNGDEVIAIGHPYGLNYTATQGVISRLNRVRQGLHFIQVDAAINPGNSGGPLVNQQGQIIGVNTFIIKGGDNLGFALPVSYLKAALDLYMPYRGSPACRCPNCNYLVLPANIESGKYCPSCGSAVSLPQASRMVFAPGGPARLIEEILQETGKDVRLARNGANKWEVRHGDARIRISYNTETDFITGDAYICQLPEEGERIRDLYVFLLQENDKARGLVWSCAGRHVVLSALFNLPEFTRELGVRLMQDLFQEADRHSRLLIERFRCKPRLEE